MRVLSVKKGRILIVVFKLDQLKIVLACESTYFFVIILARQSRTARAIVKPSVPRHAEKKWACAHVGQRAQ